MVVSPRDEAGVIQSSLMHRHGCFQKGVVDETCGYACQLKSITFGETLYPDIHVRLYEIMQVGWTQMREPPPQTITHSCNRYAIICYYLPRT